MTRRAWDSYWEAVSSHIAWAVTGVIELKGARRGLLTELWDHHPASLLAFVNQRRVRLVVLTIVTYFSSSMGNDGLLRGG